MAEISGRPSSVVPVRAVTEIGNTFYCYIVSGGKAVQTPVKVGAQEYGGCP